MDCEEGLLKYEYKIPPTYTPENNPLRARDRDAILQVVLDYAEKDAEGNISRSHSDVLYEEWDRKVNIEVKYKN